MDKLCLPVIIAKRPIWDTFPGAWYTIAIDVCMPNGRTLQVASVHHYRDQWAKAFDIKYEDGNAEQQFCHQTTYGMSERLLGALVGMHGDDQGLIMPPAIAPIQVVIIPVLHTEGKEEVLSHVDEVANTLRNAGLRVKVDSRDIRAAKKYFDWEIKGVPLRLEIGRRDIENGTVFAAKRTGGKEPLPVDDVVNQVREQLDNIANILRERAASHVDGRIKKFPKIGWKADGSMVFNELKEGTIYEMPFDGSDAHAEEIEKFSGFNILGDSVEEFAEERVCVVTGKPTKRRVYLARTY